jgi:hypothetical protein
MWKAKLVFLLVVYFAGFATAVYYLAPNGRMDCQAASYSNSSDNSGVVESDKPQNNTSALFKGYYDKAAASFNNMDTEQFKAAFNRSIEKLKEMAKSSQNTKTDVNTDK